ncbi:MAG TPA: hypothetical protein VJX94_28895 [Stellaceae bacterium]|nr:hypothetical protein [Stellaceae bacterium]
MAATPPVEPGGYDSAIVADDEDEPFEELDVAHRPPNASNLTVGRG